MKEYNIIGNAHIKRKENPNYVHEKKSGEAVKRMEQE